MHVVFENMSIRGESDDGEAQDFIGLLIHIFFFCLMFSFRDEKLVEPMPSGAHFAPLTHEYPARYNAGLLAEAVRSSG